MSHFGHRSEPEDPISKPLTIRLFPVQRPISHVHDRPSLIWSHASLTLTTHIGSWPVPPERLTWVPAWTRFTLASAVARTATLILLDPGRARTVDRALAVLAPDPLLDALAGRLRAEPLFRQLARHRRLLGVLLDLVRETPALPLLVRSAARTRFANLVEPSGQGPWPGPRDLALAVGRSRRTIDRNFVQELGVTAGRWRRQQRWARAMALLADGIPVKDVALDVGYKSPSAFVAAFRREMGVTPKKLMRGRRPPNP